MRIAELSQSLRATSDRFGGVKHYLAAAGDLDRACSTFFREQTLESLTALHGALARANRLKMEIEVSGKGPVAV